MKFASILLLILCAAITTAYDYSLDGLQLRRHAPSDKEVDNEVDNEIEPDAQSRHLNGVFLTGINNRIATTRGIGSYHEYPEYDYSSGRSYSYSKSYKSSKSSKKSKKSKKSKGSKKSKKSKSYKSSKSSKSYRYYEHDKRAKPYMEYGKLTKPYY